MYTTRKAIIVVHHGPAPSEVNARRYPYGVQPALGVIWQRGLTVSHVAREISITHGRLYTALRGGCRVQDDVREALPKFLGVPLENLFTHAALEPVAQFTVRRFTELRQARQVTDTDTDTSVTLSES